MVATNSPITTNDSESPAASATGPHFCFAAAAPSTIGISGRTQGESTESTPATNDRTRPVIAGTYSQSHVEEVGNRGAVGVADRAALLLAADEGDQRRLLLRPEAADEVLLT